MQQVAPAPGRPICHKVKQQVTSVGVTSTGPPGLGSGRTQPAMGRSGCICLLTGRHLGKVVAKLQDYPWKRMILIAPGWPNMPWFWGLVAMLNQIPLCLPHLPNLLTQPFNVTPQRYLFNLNLHVWLPEPPLSRSRASLRQWQHELRLLKEDQPDQSMRQSGPFLTPAHKGWGYSRPLRPPGVVRGRHKACGCSTALNPCTDFHQIFRICLPQEDLGLIRFWGVSGNNCCHGNTFNIFWS